MSQYNEYQSKWFAGKDSKSKDIKEYIDFIELMKKEEFPIKIKFGLEVCYSPQHEHDIEEIEKLYDFDLIMGSIHFIDGFAFSHLKQRWSSNDVDINKLYDRYYSIMIKLVKSNLFSGLATLIRCSVLEHIRQRTIVIIIKSLLVNFIREACMLKRAVVLQ